MAIYIPNQPVFFGEQDACSNSDFVYNQLVDVSDTTQFQLRLEPCISAPQLVVNSNFADNSDWTLGDNVGIGDNQMCWQGDTIAGTGGSFAYTSSIYTVDGYYQLVIECESISNGAMGVYIGATYVGSFNSVGTHTFYGFATDFFTLTPVIIYPESDGVLCCLNSVTSFEILTNFIVAIYESNGTYATQINYTDNSEFFTFSKDTVTVSVDWSELGLSNGCYYLCILDPCENTNGQNAPAEITNGNFTGSATGWSLGAAWSYSSNAVNATYSILQIDNLLIQENVFNSLTTNYSVEIDITAITGSVTVSFGSNVVATLNSTGVHTVTGVPIGYFDITITISSGTCTITSVLASEVTPSEYTCNMTSNLFKLADYTNDCTLLVNACNNEDGLGFVFEDSGFTPRLRLQAVLKEGKYANERNTYTDSLGKKFTYYFSGRKSKYFSTDLQPEYILDYLWTLFGYDNVFIDGELYAIDDDEFSPEWPFDNVGKVKFLVSKKEQNVKNANCSDTESICTLPPNVLLQTGLDFNIVQTDGSRILIN